MQSIYSKIRVGGENTNSVRWSWFRRFGSWKIERDSRFKKVDDKDTARFESILDSRNNPSSVLYQKTENLSAYNTDWLRKYKGEAPVVLKPKQTQEVSALLEYCNANNIAVCVQGGNTGLVGGSVPVFDEVIINLSRMNNILSFDEQSGILQCEAGVILENADKYLREKYTFIYPLDLGAKGSCQIGGNISTNAGGLRLLRYFVYFFHSLVSSLPPFLVFLSPLWFFFFFFLKSINHKYKRYGNLHGNVMGLEVVLANGNVLNLQSNNIKDNTGYDLKHLFIGSEGTLGVITKASVLCMKEPTSYNLLFLALPSFANALKVKLLAKRVLNEIISAIEFADFQSLKFPLTYLHNRCSFPLEGKYTDYPFYMLIETSGSNDTHDKEKLTQLIETLFNEKLISAGTIAQDMGQFRSIWTLREGIGPGIGESKRACYKYDVSLPLYQMYDVVENCRVRVEEMLGHDTIKRGEIDVVGYGHLGDGNLHLNVVTPTFASKYENVLEPWIYDQCSYYRGSISAEHGLGRMKGNMIHYNKSALAVNLMKNFKQLLDPKGILNPYKLKVSYPKNMLWHCFCLLLLKSNFNEQAVKPSQQKLTAFSR
ncbi:hypothetical protein RFI_23834 [Reticulomyxa filosa]|uniref:FAD-binding PCMH-type domain-containing protein n=1 Tax=Reticulomyxa filosa TaxID=46433 RepID=X6MHP6_RETFI|nr:hypothetical protein RFI_23834 [Reticulomyxa filosa]|eukprot:ETO13538.1 hypothetical protein RFI_23834 [Reticulomyxa filosa]